MAPASFLVLMLKDPTKKDAVNDDESEDMVIEASTLIVAGDAQD